jgi:hypothetical protein
MSDAKPCPLADYIRVYRDGRIESCLTRGRIGGKTDRWRPLAVTRPSGGGSYPTVSLKIDGKFRPVKVHLIVAYAWHGPPKPGQICRHLDDNPNNFDSDNLAWGTHAENMQDAIRNGRYLVGERHHRIGIRSRPKPKTSPLSPELEAYRLLHPGRGRKAKRINHYLCETRGVKNRESHGLLIHGHAWGASRWCNSQHIAEMGVIAITIDRLSGIQTIRPYIG